MSLDIRAGDFLVVGSQTYPILFCGAWDQVRSTVGFRRMCSVTASTKRSPAMVGGTRGEPVTKLASIKCTPIDPINGKTVNMVVRDLPTAPTDLKECFVDGGAIFYHLVLEKALMKS